MPDRIEDVLPDDEFAEFLHTIRNEVRQSSPCFCIGGGRVLNDHAAILLSRRGRNEAADDDIVAAIILAEIVLVAVILDRRDDEMARMHKFPQAVQSHVLSRFGLQTVSLEPTDNRSWMRTVLILLVGSVSNSLMNWSSPLP